MKPPKLQPWIKKILTVHSRWITPLLIVLTLVGFYLGSGLKLRLSLSDLLPENHPSVVKFDKITEVVGGDGYLIALLTAPDKKSHYKIVPEIITELEKSPLVRTVFIDREEYFFASRMLYYLDLPKLEELETSIDKQIRAARRNVIDLGLWDEEETKSEGIDKEVIKKAQRTAEITPYLVSADEANMLLMIKPTFPSFDIGKSKALIKLTKETLTRMLPDQVSFEMAGRYNKKIEDARIITGDIFFLGLLAIFLIGILLFFYLRSIRAVLLILIPVVMGLGLTIGITRLCIGHINIITGFLIGIVSGLGMDYSVHLALRLRLEHDEPSFNDPDPLWRSLATGGHGVFIGAVAAAAAFFMLCFSSFTAFSEFGFVCGVGITCVAGSLLLTFSQLAKWFKMDNPATAFAKTKKFRSLPHLSTFPRFLIAGMVTVFLGIAAFNVDFEYNFRRMMQHSEKVRYLSDMVDTIYNRSVTPSVFAATTKEQAEKTEDILMERYVPDTVETIISGATIVPEDQAKKKVVMKRIQKKINRYKDKWLEKELDIPGQTIRRWVAAQPFNINHLPIHLQDALRGKEKSGYLMYVYAPLKLDLATAHGVKVFANMIRDIEAEVPGLLAGSDTVVFDEILTLIKKDGLHILLTIFLAVGFFIWLTVRRWDDTLITYIPLLIALPVGIGMMSLLGIRFNIFNIAIIPSFVAIGIDVPIHMVHRARQIKSGFKASRDIAAAVHLALLTTGIGFGVLIFARAGVLRSLGWLAILGTLAIWWTGMFILPCYLEWLHNRKGKSNNPDLDGPKPLPKQDSPGPEKSARSLSP